MTATLLFIAGILSLAAIYAILTLALNVDAGYAGLWDLGIAGYFALGAYTYTLLTMAPPESWRVYDVGFGLPIWAGVLGACLVPLLAAYVIGRPTLRLRKEYLLIATFAFAEVIHQVLTNEIWLTNGTSGFHRLEQPFRAAFTSESYIVFFAILVLGMLAVVYAILARLSRSPIGRTLRALRENEAAAQAAGKNVSRLRLHAFVITATIAGLAGVLYVWHSTIVVPNMFTATVTFTVWTALVIGGIGNPRGAVVGAFILLLLQEMTRFFQISAEFAVVLSAMREVFLGLLLILVVRFLPRGVRPEQPELLLRHKPASRAGVTEDA